MAGLRRLRTRPASGKRQARPNRQLADRDRFNAFDWPSCRVCQGLKKQDKATTSTRHITCLTRKTSPADDGHSDTVQIGEIANLQDRHSFRRIRKNSALSPLSKTAKARPVSDALGPMAQLAWAQLGHSSGTAPAPVADSLGAQRMYPYTARNAECHFPSETCQSLTSSPQRASQCAAIITSRKTSRVRRIEVKPRDPAAVTNDM